MYFVVTAAQYRTSVYLLRPESKHLSECGCAFVYKVSPYKYAIAIVRNHRPAPLKGSPKHGNSRRITAWTITTHQEKNRGEPQRNHPAATVQKPQGAAPTSPQALPVAVYAGEDPAMDPETRDPGAHHPPSRGPTEPGGPGPNKHPPEVQRLITNLGSKPEMCCYFTRLFELQNILLPSAFYALLLPACLSTCCSCCQI
ncbi:hypothetical protein XENORESO_006167 [Xenotaenia resolanae]|uniref:Uncharacterized protein n=1 Tax=Xenotaenia resolanae TaxID=208358 RepID=A0ABV0X6Z4_9TELE